MHSSHRAPDPSGENRTAALEALAIGSLGCAAGLAVIEHDGTLSTANAAFRDHLRLPDDVLHPSIADLCGAALQADDATTLTVRPSADAGAVRLHLTPRAGAQRIIVSEPVLPNSNARGGAAAISHAHVDPLTQLGNRRLLNETIAAWRPGDDDDAQSLTAIMMDLDRFKHVNDTLGHGAGDTLLKLVAQRVRRTARPADVVVRLGGDEFLILHTGGAQSKGAEAVAQRLVDLIGRPFLVDGQQVNIGASVGIAVLDRRMKSHRDLLKHADLALYAAKDAGRGTYRFFEPILEERAVERRELELRLRRAVGLRQFSIVFQPQVAMPSGLLSGFEALLRWNCPDRGMVSPEDFIPLAEETGEIHTIGSWVLREACREAMQWPDDLILAVNVSPVQFDSDSFVDLVQSALASSGLPAHRLELEITEGVLLNNPDAAFEQLWEFKRMGIKIAMDDFGTGYSSLSYLNNFPFSKIKIDQTFVRCKKTARSRALVHAILSLGASLGMTTMAEGVETREQFDELAKSGCAGAQGYLFSRPMEQEAVGEFIRTYRLRTDPMEESA